MLAVFSYARFADENSTVSEDKKHLIVSPMCPRTFDASTSLSILFQELSNVFSHLLVSEAIADCMRLRLREGE